MPNNFPKAIPDIKQSMKTISMFKDEYLLDFINTENLGQLCTYLQALDLTVKKPHENSSIGIVLCKEMSIFCNNLRIAVHCIASKYPI